MDYYNQIHKEIKALRKKINTWSKEPLGHRETKTLKGISKMLFAVEQAAIRNNKRVK